MAVRLATLAARRLRSINFFSRRSAPQFHSLRREDEESYSFDDDFSDSDDGGGFRKVSNLCCEYNFPTVFETNHKPLSSTPNPKPKPKPDIYYVNNNKSKSNLDILVNYHNSVIGDYFGAYLFKEDGTLSSKYYTYPPSFLFEQNYSFTGAASNTLFHFHNSDTHVIWNSTTNCIYPIFSKPFFRLPPHHLLSRVHPMLFGMWQHRKSPDYKLLELTAHFLKDEQNDCSKYAIFINLYSLRTRSWKTIPCPPLFEVHWTYHSALLSGVFYCSVFRMDHRMASILAFDLATETLTFLPRPTHFQDSTYVFLEYKGLLCAVEHLNRKYYGLSAADYFNHNYDFVNDGEDEDDREDFDALKFWVWRDGKWTKEFVFKTYGVGRPLRFSDDGRLLYFASVNDQLVVFDRATGEMKHLGVPCAFDSNKEIVFPFSLDSAEITVI